MGKKSATSPLRSLRETEARWQAVLDTAQDAIISIDASGRITLFNVAAERIFGYHADEVIGQNVGALMPSPYREEHDAYIRTYERTGEAKAIGRIRNVHGRRKNGEVFPIELSVGEARTDSQVLYTAIIRDVSVRERSERQLRAQYAVTRVLAEGHSLREVTPRLLEAVCECLGCVVGELWHVDTDAGLLRWDGMWHSPSFDSADFEEMSRMATMATGVGIPGRVWASGAPVWASDVTTDPTFVRCSLAARLGLHAAAAFPLLHGREVSGVMMFFRREACEPDRETLEMLDAFGRQIGDFMERARAQEALGESERRFAEFMRYLPGVAFMKDVNGRYVYINPTFGKIFHCTLADLQGKTDDSIFPPDIVRALRENDQEVIESGQAIQIVEQVPHDGELHHWLATKFPVFDGAGNLVMVAGMAIDISERVRAEARMRDLERAAQQRQRLADIGAITAQIVHDLGNPIAAVSMQAQLIVRRARREGNEGILKAAEQIVSRVRHLDTMVREFLDFTREQRLALTNVDLRRLLSEVVDLWRPVASSHTIAIDLDLPSDVPPVVADEEKLRRVFDNLIKNAVEAIDSGPGSVTVRVSAPNDERVRVSIEDTGPGIPQNLEVFRLFETTKSFGTGLGLPISQQIVLVHGGGIEFAAVEPHGTVFHVDLRRKGPAG